jgi:hypothetical protein
MSFQNLPDHLLQHIYEYDITYHDVYKKCVNEISGPISETKFYVSSFIQNKFEKLLDEMREQFIQANYL